MKSTIAAIAITLALVGTALAKDNRRDHSAEYQVGTFVETQRVDTGSVSQGGSGGLFGGRNVRTQNLGHNAAVVSVPDGQYTINQPFSVGAAMFGGSTVDPHKAWFMDQMHAGDKVLFAAKCNKHNDCQIRVPNPDKPGKEIMTDGRFEPAVAKTNTNALCGTGKLTADVEAQVCTPQTAVTPEPPPTPSEIAAEQAKQAQQYADCLKAAVNNPSIVCK
jgi:hypothetical protein